MKQKVDTIASALLGIESDRQLTPEIVEEALKEALTKAYRKHIEIPDAYVKTEIKDGIIHIYHQRVVVEEVEDDELEISLKEAKKINKDAKLGDMIDEEVDYTQFDRAAVVLAKNVIKQKIREAEKQIVYEEYCDKVDEMVMGTVETVEPKFVIVNIGKTLAMMKKSQQIPGETYYEGQNLLVVITEVNKETKGAQVLVSRATPVFVRRLFEREVPEIYQGIIEIKAIAREPGERCKIAVYTHNENIDPIGACIGPRGSRVQMIINELHGEKIDIFEWSDNIADLIKNALSPSEAIAVIPNENVKDGLIVVVPESQLSLAIGKRGKNARLAVKLTNRKIDIKSDAEMEEAGIDYMAISKAMQEEYEAKKAKERAYKQQQRIEELNQTPTEIENVDVADFTYDDDVLLDTEEDMPLQNTTTLFEKEQEKKELDEMEEAARIAKAKRKEKASIAPSTEYTSKFENFADASSKQETAPVKSKKKQEEVKETTDKHDLSEVKQQFEQMKPIYSEEELAEIEAQQMEEENVWDEDVDYEEFDEYYDD
ncbi:transcription termination factor NusA [Faecalicoccus pleomorphus]|uniref:transcription termination factor NusA n=1 Tax=Faecalicoccus pleomorphus TaxID=1323 RepID=UPI001961DE5D|nr:transcription termination factor NusA [Faecalicoccus pleomorphus]MBM6677410.1 transcription termination/antitermination protein NusA [Faecalicoccus pleomorphus]MBM6764782.1 transcription termination/antitermination protein NusA [Faecalicoccus pleomorphus]MDB7985951.1 transcription termination factor NusA [Faecalicoccus pleomorphus]MDB7991718.1 transcription termination factor NusA [Faecalicoccus pleomorphus]MDM8291662.1 transcription termination factor NusA [Faecalicoccus pleomorphus]